MRTSVITIVSGLLLASIVVPAPSVLAQEGTKDPAVASSARTLTAASSSIYEGLQKLLVASAQKMPEKRYDFKPVEGVRSFGRILGHVADSQYLFCSRVLGEENPAPRVEENATSKTELIEALESAFSYCERAYAALDDVSATEMVTFMGGKPKLTVLTTNQVHTIEHYGNLVTYMRMNEIVPPTSDPEFMKQFSR